MASPSASSAAAALAELSEHFFRATAGEAEARLEEAGIHLREVRTDTEALLLDEEVPAAQVAQLEGRLREVFATLQKRTRELIDASSSAAEHFASCLDKATALLGPAPDADSLLTCLRSRVQELKAGREELAEAVDQRLDAVTQHATREQLEKWMVLDAGKPRGRSEALAKTSLEEGRVSQGAVLEVLQACDLPLQQPGSRPGASETAEAKSMTLGLYTYGNTKTAALTKATKDHPYLLRILIAHYRQLCEEPVTSVTVAEDFTATDHTDNNLGTSKITTLGEHKGGRLFIDKDARVDEHGDDEEVVHKVRNAVHNGGKPYRLGDEVLGVYISTHGLLRAFDAFYLHWTEPFQGKRFTVTYYVSRAVELCTDEKQNQLAFQLGQAGLRWPTAQELQGFADARASDRAFKKICYPPRLFKRAAAESSGSQPVVAVRERASDQGESSDPPEAAPPCPCVEDKSTFEEESPAALLAAKRAARALLAVDSNNKGGNGVKMVTDQQALLLKKVGSLRSSRLKSRIRELLEAMLIRPSKTNPHGTFCTKTPATFRVFVLEVLVLLNLPSEEVADLRKHHKLRDKDIKSLTAAGDTRRAWYRVSKLKKTWKDADSSSRKRKQA